MRVHDSMTLIKKKRRPGFNHLHKSPDNWIQVSDTLINVGVYGKPLWYLYLSLLLFLKAQHPTEYTKIRTTKMQALQIANVLHCDFMLARRPALHDLQSKHSCFWSLLHVLQSVSATAGPVFGTTQNVAFLNSKPQ